MNTCQNNISPKHLSAYRSHILAQTEMTHLTAHIAHCIACQDILRNYEQLAQALLTQASPLDGRQLWRSVHQHITREGGIPMSQSRRLWLSAVLITVTLVLVTVGALLSLHPQLDKTHLVATATTAPTSTLIPTPTVQTLQPLPGQDWTQLPALATAKSISFSQHNPLTGYACGNNSQGGVHGMPFHITRTMDGGRTWQMLPDTPPTTNLACQISVSPTDPLDVVLWTTACWGNGCDRGPSFVSRSRDGGMTWSPLTIPSGNENNNYTSLSGPVWAGSTLFFIATLSSYQTAPTSLPLASHQVAVSINGGSLHWIDAPSVAGNIVGEQFALGDTYYIAPFPCVPENVCPALTTLQKTSDGGQTWSTVTLTGDRPNEVTSGDDSKTLVGNYVGDRFGESSDGGVTWTKLPALPTGFDSGFNLPEKVPDGTLYVLPSPKNGAINVIYKLLPGAATWTKVVTLTKAAFGQAILTISWDTDGHPVAIWGLTGNIPAPQSGISYHAP